VKFEATQVGRPAVQRLVGARGRERSKQLLFFSGTGFSANAIDYANEMDVALFHYSLTGEMQPLNQTARLVARRRDQHAPGTNYAALASARRTRVSAPKKARPRVWTLLTLGAVVYAIWATTDAFRGKEGAWQSAALLVVVFLRASLRSAAIANASAWDVRHRSRTTVRLPIIAMENDPV
jgi:hypothetical protein